MKDFQEKLYGIALCLVIGITALLISRYIPIGAVALSIMLGIIVGNVTKLNEIFKAGITFSEKQILSFAIALLGVNLDFMILEKLGIRSAFIIVVAMGVTLSSSIVLAKIFKFKKRFALLLGIGNGVCGSSAIAATKDIIGADEEEVGVSIAVVNFLGTIGIFLLPFIGTVLLKFTDIKAGMFIGNTLQAVGQVVAAGFSVSESSGQAAIIVKMVRILMLTPLVFVLIFIFSTEKFRHLRKSEKKSGVPLFIIAFVIFSLIPTFRLLPESWIKVLSKISHYSLIVAMAGVGMKITFKDILKDGKKAFLIGGLIFALQIVFSSSLIFMLLK